MSNTSASAVFEAFIEASKALEELPAVKIQLANITSDRDGALHQLEAAESVIKSHEDEIAALKAQLEAKEASLADATFRHKEVSGALDNIKSVLSSLVPPTPVVVTPIEASPAPEPATLGESVSTPSTEVSPSSSAISTSVETQDTVPGANEQDQRAFPPDYRPSHTELSNPSAVTGTNSGTSPSAIDETAASPVSASTPTTSTPEPRHDNEAYWLKPDSMTWDQWALLGGQPAPWVSSSH